MLNGVFPTLEVTFLLLTLVLMWRSQERRLLVAMIPFFLLLISYQILRGFADDFTPAEIHVADLIAAEKRLFGGLVPAAFIQAHFPALLARYLDPIASIIYMSHFVNPVVMAITLWYRKREWYWPFVFSLVVLSYMAFVTFLLFPAAPPWWATKYGYLVDQPVTLSHFTMPLAMELGSPNPVAAMPSLHCAYPTFITAIGIAAWGRKGWWFLVPSLAIAFSTLYLGHHWVIDIIAGVVYGLVACGIAVLGHSIRTKR